jgi:hypothetical protein
MNLYSSLQHALDTQYQAISNMLVTIDEARLVLRPHPDKWNIHDNIAHLAAYQPVYYERVHRILTMDVPVFGRYLASDDPYFDICRRKSVADLLQVITEGRKEISELIAAVPNLEASKTGIHPKYGALNILQWTEFFILHEAHHLFTIFQLAHDVELR